MSATIKNALDWLSRSYNEQPLHKRKIGVISTSFLSQNQVEDIEDIVKLNGANFYKNNFYVSLKEGPCDQNTGELIKEETKLKISYWYQCFSTFVMSGLPDPEIATFVLW